MDYFNKIKKIIKEKIFRVPESVSTQYNTYGQNLIKTDVINKDNETAEKILHPNNRELISESLAIKQEIKEEEGPLEKKILIHEEKQNYLALNKSLQEQGLTELESEFSLGDKKGDLNTSKTSKKEQILDQKVTFEMIKSDDSRVEFVQKISNTVEIPEPSFSIQNNSVAKMPSSKDLVSFFYREGKEYVLTMTNLTPKLIKTQDKEVNSNYKAVMETPVKENHDQTQQTQSSIDSKQETKDPLGFLDDTFETNLDKIINSKDFIERSSTLFEVPDFKDNKDYIFDYQKNDDTKEVALEMLVYANRGLVSKNVSRYKGFASVGFSEDDMFQSGMIGLMKAAKRFDLDRGVEFSTYATHWIKQGILRGIMNNSSTVRVPVHMGELIKKINRCERKSYSIFGVVDYDWIASELEVPLDKVLEAIKVQNTFMNNVSLDTPVGVEGATLLGELIEDESGVDPSSFVVEESLQEIILSLLDDLKPREKDVIIKRFGLDGKGVRTLEAIGLDYGVTRERIRQIEAKALRRLKQTTNIIQLKEYYEVY